MAFRWRLVLLEVRQSQRTGPLVRVAPPADADRCFNGTSQAAVCSHIAPTYYHIEAGLPSSNSGREVDSDSEQYRAGRSRSSIRLMDCRCG